MNRATFLIILLLSTVVLKSQTEYPGSAIAIALNQPGVSEGTCNITGQNTLTNIKVKLNISGSQSSFLNYLKIILISPTGESITLASGSSLVNGYINGSSMLNTIFDDNASSSITNATPPYIGSYRPEQFLSSFNSISANGVWRLVVYNQNSYPGNCSWSLIISSDNSTPINPPDFGTEYQGGNLIISQNKPGVTTDTLKINSIGTVTDINVLINAGPSGGNTTFVQYLKFVLISPSGTSVELARGDQIYGGALNGAALYRTLFDDEATATITNGGQPYVGNYKPREELSAFDGESKNGVWRLVVYNQNSYPGNCSWSLLISSDNSTPITPPDFGTEYQGGNLIIPQNKPGVTTDTLKINSIGTVTDINVLINAGPSGGNTTFVQYLKFVLISPSGTSVELARGDQIYGGALNGAALYRTLFDDEATATITNGGQPYVGNYKPREELSAFDGESKNGVWRLVVYNQNSYPGNCSWSLLISSDNSTPIIPPDFGTEYQGGNLLIPQGMPGVTTDTMTIMNNGYLVDINVLINAEPSGGNTTFVQYLKFILISPFGTSVELARGDQISGGALNGAALYRTLFDDEATATITNGGQPYVGRFKPLDPIYQFRDQQLKGIWTLAILNQNSYPGTASWAVYVKSVPILLRSPSNFSINQAPTNLLFSWKKSLDPAPILSYKIEILKDTTISIFSFIDSTIIDTQTVVSGLEYDTEYFWRVSSKNLDGWGKYSDWFTFKTIVERPAIVQLTGPENNSTRLIQPVRTTWRKSQRGEKYTIEVASDTSFNNLAFSDSLLIDTTKVLPILNNLTKYYWRVRSRNIGGQSDWSSIYNFRTLGLATSPVLLFPEFNSLNLATSQVFKWSRSFDQKTVTKYWFELSKDSLFTLSVIRDTSITDTSKSVSNLDYSTTYYWRVRAKNEAGWGNFSDAFKFSTIIERPATVIPTHPVNASTGITLNPVLIWRKANRAEKYLLQLSIDSLFANTFLQDSTITDTSRQVTGLSEGTTYFWRVKAMNVGGTSNYSQPFRFTTFLGSPYNLQTSIDSISKIKLYWTDNSTNETFYVVERKKGDSLSTQPFINISGNLASNTSSFTDTSAFFDNIQMHFTYRVKALTQTAQSSYSNLSVVSLELPVPKLSYPLNRAINIKQVDSLKWYSLITSTTILNHPGNFLYNLQISSDSLFSSPLLTDTTSLDTIRAFQLSDGIRYFWRVRGKIGILGLFSSTWSFSTDLKAPDSLRAISSDSGRVRLAWKDNTQNETGYLLEKKSLYHPDSQWEVILLPKNSTDFTDINVHIDSSYQYRLKAFNQIDTSLSSSTIELVVTDIKDSKQLPDNFFLFQNYPNPFNPSTIIKYALPSDATVLIQLFGIDGSLIQDLFKGTMGAGNHFTQLDFHSLSSGSYLLRFVAYSKNNRYERTIKLQYLK